MKETRRKKPSVIDVAEGLRFPQRRVPEIGPGSHKPNRGRGGVVLSDNYYLGEPDLIVKEKKGQGAIISPPKKEANPEKPKWSDCI